MSIKSGIFKIVSLFALLLVMGVSSIRAQQNSPLPAPSSPTVSTTSSPALGDDPNTDDDILSSDVIDSGSDPNLIAPDLDLTAAEANGASYPESRVFQPDKYWHTRYHPQVNEQVFQLLHYPYYRGGRPYPAGLHPKNPGNNQSSPVVNVDPNAAGSSPRQTPGADAEAVVLADPDELRYGMEKCFDLIHRWRSLNESAGTALEIVYAVELTKTSTGIYRIQPKLAVTVKRTVGQLARMNCKFDVSSRLLMQNILAGNFDKRLAARLEKQISDIETLLDRLARQNDHISVVLGRGHIDRSLNTAAGQKKIEFSQSDLAISPASIFRNQ